MTVFLSYARVDAQSVDAMTAELDRRQIPYWRDQRDLPVAYAWSPEAHRAIRAAPLVVLCQSPSWEASPACRSEERMAAELHKRTLVLDILNTSAADAARAVETGLAGLDSVDADHRELLVRSGAWVDAGRQRASLVRGDVLRRLTHVASLGRSLPADARVFLEESNEDDRRRKRQRWLGGLLVAVLLPAGHAAQRFSTNAEDTFRKNAAAITELTRIHELTLDNPYGGLMAAADLVRAGSDGALGVSALVEALDSPVPAQSVEVADQALAAFVDRFPDGPAVSTDSGALLDTAGKPIPGRTSTVVEPRAARRGGTTVQARQTDLVATGTGSGTVLIRSGTTAGTEVAPDHTAGPVTAVALNAATDAVAILYAESGSVSVHDATSGALRVRVAVGTPARAVALSPDGRTLATASGDDIVLTDLTTGHPQPVLRGVPGPARAVTWSADGASVLAINGDHRLSRWQWRTGQRLVDEPDAWFVGLSSAADDGSVLAVTRSGDVYRVGPAGHQVIARTGVTVTSTGFDRSTDRVLLAQDTGQTRLVDLRTDADRIVDDGRGCQSVTPTLVPGTNMAITGCFGGPIRRIDLTGAEPSHDLAVPAGTGAVTVTTNGDIYIAGSTGLAWGTTVNLTPVVDLKVPPNVTSWRTITASADGGRLVLTGTGTGKIGHFRVGQLASGSWSWYTIDLPPDDGEQSRAAALSATGLAAVGMVSGTVHFVAPSGNLGRTLSEVPGSVTGATFVGDRLMVATRDGVIATMEACLSCDSADGLLRLANQRLDAGRSLGLVPK